MAWHGRHGEGGRGEEGPGGDDAKTDRGNQLLGIGASNAFFRREKSQPPLHPIQQLQDFISILVEQFRVFSLSCDLPTERPNHNFRANPVARSHVPSARQRDRPIQNFFYSEQWEKRVTAHV